MTVFDRPFVSPPVTVSVGTAPVRLGVLMPPYTIINLSTHMGAVIWLADNPSVQPEYGTPIYAGTSLIWNRAGSLWAVCPPGEPCKLQISYDVTDWEPNPEALAMAIADALFPVIQSVVDDRVAVAGDEMMGDLRLLDPAVLRVDTQGDVTLASTLHGFQIGPDSGLNVAMDDNEIQARNNGVASVLNLNYNGGMIRLGTGPGRVEIGDSGHINAPSGIHVDGTTLWEDGSSTFARSMTVNDVVHITNDDVEQLRLKSTTNLGFMAFYHNATRRGVLGVYPAGQILLQADNGTLTVMSANNDTYIGATSGAGTHTWIRSGAQIMFKPFDTERARFDTSGNFVIGHTVNSLATPCAYITIGGQIACTTESLSVPAFIVNKINAANAGSSDFVNFRLANVTQGGINMNAGKTAVVFNTTSDYRLKDDRGAISDGLERVMQLIPRRVHWKHTPEDAVEDAFFAHEVAEVVPLAVTGEKDAVDEDGEIKPQMLDNSKLVPLLVAAIQDLTVQVATLRKQVVSLTNGIV